MASLTSSFSWCLVFFNGFFGTGISSCSFEDIELLRSPLFILFFKCFKTRVVIFLGLVFSYFFFHFFRRDLYRFFIICSVRTPPSYLQISIHLQSKHYTALIRAMSSSIVHFPLRTFGSRWLNHFSLYCWKGR